MINVCLLHASKLTSLEFHFFKLAPLAQTQPCCQPNMTFTILCSLALVSGTHGSYKSSYLAHISCLAHSLHCLSSLCTNNNTLTKKYGVTPLI